MRTTILGLIASPPVKFFIVYVLVIQHFENELIYIGVGQFFYTRVSFCVVYLFAHAILERFDICNWPN